MPVITSSVVAAVAAISIQSGSSEYFTDGDWTYLGRSQDQKTAVLARDFTGKATSRRGWVRYEFQTPSAGSLVKSTRSLIEFDCYEGRSRTLQWMGFTENDLQGTQSFQPPGTWVYVAPGTMGEATWNHFCAPATANLPIVQD